MLTIIVDSFDGYSDLWPNFFSVFNKYWADCPYDVRLVSNYQTFQGVDTINVGEETFWSERTLKAVKQVDSEYVLLLLEDYLFGAPIESRDIENALEFMKKNDGKYLRLTNIPEGRFVKDKDIFPLFEDEEYAINLQAAIWEKNFLINSLEKHPGSAWDFEIGFLTSAVRAKHQEMSGCYGMLKDPLHIHNGVLKGKWFPKEIKYFAKRGIQIPWQKRGKLSIGQAIKYRMSVAIKNRLSYKMRKKIKRVLRKTGVKFASDL